MVAGFNSSSARIPRRVYYNKTSMEAVRVFSSSVWWNVTDMKMCSIYNQPIAPSTAQVSHIISKLHTEVHY